MSTMVMCAPESNSSGMFQRHPSPTTYGYNPFPGYGAQGAQYTQDYNQFPVPDPSVQQAWYSAMYGGGRPEDWTSYPPASSSPGAGSPPTLGTYSYRTGHMGLDYSQSPQGLPMNPMASPSMDSQGNTSSSSSSPGGSPTNKQLRPPYDWMKKASYQATPQAGKTRTKDKYRVVYSDHQRLELEKEFHYSRYITIRRKAELAQNLALSERQVKIWFQNRRAKERKQNKKRDESNKLGMSADIADDIKPQLQQHNHMITHAQPHLPPRTPSPSSTGLHHSQLQHSMQQHHQYQLHHAQVQGQGQLHPDPLSPQQQLQHLPISPCAVPVPVSPDCRLSPVTIKTDQDAQEGPAAV